MNDKNTQRELVKKDFKFYLSHVARSARNSSNKFTLGESAVKSFLSFVEVDKLFDYDPDKWAHIESIYDITNPDEINRIADELLSDERFILRDNEKNQYFRSGSLGHYICFLNARTYFSNNQSQPLPPSPFSPLQRIYYGAPGTGKSNEVNVLTGEGKDGIQFGNDHVFRTTFHPDSDYSTFVGAYKPCWDQGQDKIIYAFRPQSFLRAYVDAWLHPGQSVALVIEEINRGNCAQIFGDIFQLLDRHQSGLSKYPIAADIDMQGYLARELAAMPGDCESTLNSTYQSHYGNAFGKIRGGEMLALPQNLSILATMNTSDQSLFPMDSAFKRRWEWVYSPIKDAGLNWSIEIPGCEPIDWWQFLQSINKVVGELTTSEDKQLGYFFCMPDGDSKAISASKFVGKVIFYLWNDVFKDYGFEVDCCRDGEGGEAVLFARFYKSSEEVDMDTLKQFFRSLKDASGNSLLVERRPAEEPAEDTAINDEE